ncbi:4-hydroxyphenylpyruvate dioxygenase [Volvox carteri f. nagariensis]|uniref:4-hydroxyphenylpyruvate dioxygenase n=1 Tax=Volvox carteri f. nagariensis TaxID=3068 RepID=D8U1V8_VOLCA|nr:4-hydroxyphenylpyruvate dioxygenase [Volvox carteri f. nagariensis]EFJ46247.1 4-hydroxyphenylpyruvate dioxygenase [Volvox carteri f. nagariensis]|eukprot:XP_002952694.1 4-hydroxyphenylpyruvate dioxygenase [Volvox carteri f. nagariensis]
MGSGGASTPGGREGGVKLVGYHNFVRHNPRSDKFAVQKFHHIEFWCADATNTFKRFQHGLGMTLVAKSDQSTNNTLYASYVLRSNDLVFTFTAPYSRKCAAVSEGTPLRHYRVDEAYDFVNCHGLGVKAVGLLVEDARAAYEVSVADGGKGVLAPQELTDEATGTTQTVAEVLLYGDVVLRYVSGSFTGPFLAGYTPLPDSPAISYGLQRVDHAVGNTHELLKAVEYVMGFTGFHEFAEFVAEDVGTVDSGLNSMVLASNNEAVLLPINEPTFGTPRKSQIQTYLEQNEGPGLQHLALLTNDIFATLREMRARSDMGGFEFMPRPSDKYYRELPKKIGDTLTPMQYKEVEELGILVDRDDQGVLLQIFTKPLGDRPTVFIEVIQRVGCEREVKEPTTGAVVGTEQAAGCGGFGKGNFSELFKSIEDYERTLNV